MDTQTMALLQQLATNHWLQGIVIALIAAQIRHVNTSIDATSKDPNQVKVFAAVLTLLSIATAVISAFVTGHLSSLDPQALMTTGLAAIQVIIGAFGTHVTGTVVKKLDEHK